jgi:hypothetical protein
VALAAEPRDVERECVVVVVPVISRASVRAQSL